MAEPTMSAWQQKWFATGRANFERDTGKTMAEWVAIAKTCPETRRRARLAWFKEHHGLLQNRASWVLSEAFPSEAGWDEPAALRKALWTDPASTAILEAVERAVLKLDGIVTGQRKGYSAWSRNKQFCAVRPLKGRGARLGLALEPSADPRLTPFKNESWSERLKSSMNLASANEVDGGVEDLIGKAWERS